MPNNSNTKKLRLGELFVQVGVITEEQLQKALSIQKRTGNKLGEVLLQEGFITERQLVGVLEEQLGIRSIDLRIAPLDLETAHRIPENMARRHLVIPIQVADGHLLLAMHDPLDWVAIQDVRLITGLPITPLLASERDILEAIERIFGQKRVVDQAVEDLTRSAVAANEEVAAAVEAEAIESAPVVRLVDSIIENAVRSRASDIHIEPKVDRLRIRNRVDGMLMEVLTTNMRVHGSLLTRLKVLADMNIAEKRLPQDGKIITHVDGRKIDLRVSTMPTIYGEKMVIRVLNQSSILIGKHNLGFSDADINKFNRLVARRHGIILVTGPTGSGKTTTLYTMLSEMDAVHNSIVTLEDPVEYDLEQISQTQINIAAGLTFASGLRTLMRQDPDIIMVGEIRDEETLKIAVRAALTGHLVLSTLHTNDAPGAVVRMLDMGIEPYLIASSLAGVVAQRLVRKVCPNCQEEYVPDKQECKILGIPEGENLKLVRGRGCTVCHEIGYWGRVGVFEILEVDRKLKELINDRVSTDILRDCAIKQGMKTLWEDCRAKVLKGITTLEEALRVTQTD